MKPASPPSLIVVVAVLSEAAAVTAGAFALALAVRMAAPEPVLPHLGLPAGLLGWLILGAWLLFREGLTVAGLVLRKRQLWLVPLVALTVQLFVFTNTVIQLEAQAEFWLLGPYRASTKELVAVLWPSAVMGSAPWVVAPTLGLNSLRLYREGGRAAA